MTSLSTDARDVTVAEEYRLVLFGVPSHRIDDRHMMNDDVEASRRSK
jgi:hypothetical protein